MRPNQIFTLLFIGIFMLNCSSSKTLRFSKKSDDIVKTESLKSFLSQNKNPKVVLRVNDGSYTVTEDENIDYLYNAIENQLLASGFKVRDRQLFNQIIGNDDNNVNYEVLKSKSDTDLIIELTKLDPQVKYKTNKYYDQNNREKIEASYTHERYGASVEFKVILINTNEFAGIYKFNYAPCTSGCVIKKSIKELMKESRKKDKSELKAYEGVEKNELEQFIKTATLQLVNEMRQ